MRTHDKLYILALAGIFAFICGWLLSFGLAALFNLSVSPEKTGVAFAVALWVGMVGAWAFDKTA